MANGTSKIAFLIIATVLSGCADIQYVCTSGEESEVMAKAVDFWANRGYAVALADDSSQCTIRTRITKQSCPNEQWGEAYAFHCFPKVLPKYFHPTHTIQSEIRFRESSWIAMGDDSQKKFNFVSRRYTAIHELGHIWFRDHTITGIMQESMPKNSAVQNKIINLQ